MTTIHTIARCVGIARAWHARQAIVTTGEAQAYHDRQSAWFDGVLLGLELAGAEATAGDFDDLDATVGRLGDRLRIGQQEWQKMRGPR